MAEQLRQLVQVRRHPPMFEYWLGLRGLTPSAGGEDDDNDE
jgi:hypothetical protein